MTELATLHVQRAPLLIDPWLAAGSITLLFGPPSSGKTHLTLTLARALARGEPLWGIYACTPSRVLIVQADMNTALYQERAAPHAAQLGDTVAVLSTDGLPFDVCALKAGAGGGDFAPARAFAPDIVFVDTLRKTHSADENDSAAPDRVYAAWRTLFPSAALVFLHHSRKISTQPGSADTVIREAFRGSGAWAASADTLLMLRRARRANNPDWMTRVYFVRTRSCQEPPSILLRLTDALCLESLDESPAEHGLLAWIAVNPKAKRADAVAWLSKQHLCSAATAYRLWERVIRGDNG